MFLAPLLGENAEEIIDGEYIVVFKNEIGDDQGNCVLLCVCVCVHVEREREERERTQS